MYSQFITALTCLRFNAPVAPSSAPQPPPLLLATSRPSLLRVVDTRLLHCLGAARGASLGGCSGQRSTASSDDTVVLLYH
ncbi:unnamed protein product, partial [Brenthis ino]